VAAFFVLGAGWDSLVVHLISAFIVGGAWVSFVTFVAERSGSAVGGFVGGLPSTSVFALFFIGLNQSPVAAAQATTVYPLMFSFTCFFLLVYSLLAKRGFGIAISGSLLVWFALCYVAVVSDVQFILSLVGCALFGSAIYYVFATRLRFDAFYSARLVRPTVAQILGRAVLAGSVVAVAVLLSQIGGPVLGGVFSAFPAVFSSTLYLTDKSGGPGFARAIARPLMITSILTTVPYAIAVRFLYPSIGIGLGTVLAYALALPGAYVSYLLSPFARQRRAEKNPGTEAGPMTGKVPIHSQRPAAPPLPRMQPTDALCADREE
jgi:hypothetical protein